MDAPRPERGTAMCVQLRDGVARLFRTCWQPSNLPAKGRDFRSAVISCNCPEEAKTRKPASERDVKVPLLCGGELAVSSIYAEKGDRNQRGEVLMRQMCYGVHPRPSTGSQRNSKGENQTNVPRQEL